MHLYYGTETLFQLHNHQQRSYRQNALWLQVLKLPRSTDVVSVKINGRSKTDAFISNCTSCKQKFKKHASSEKY